MATYTISQRNTTSYDLSIVNESLEKFNYGFLPRLTTFELESALILIEREQVNVYNDIERIKDTDGSYSVAVDDFSISDDMEMLLKQRDALDDAEIEITEELNQRERAEKDYFAVVDGASDWRYEDSLLYMF